MDERLQLATLGEALVVMDPASKGPLRDVGFFEKSVGGAELNVAVGLARLGHRAGWAGRLGDDEFGREILAFARGEGVDVSRASFDPESPTGVYFKEWRALGKLRVYYYRSGSAASFMSFDDLDVEYLLSADILHLTGITAVLSESCRDLVERLMAAANERGAFVSFDANVRRNLLGDRDPREILTPLVERADLLFLSDDEAELLFGADDPDSVAAARENLRAKTVTVHRADGAFAVEGGKTIERAAYEVEVADTVGAGDSFVAGYLSGLLRGWDAGECLDLANACGACAVSVPGDSKSLPMEEDVAALRSGRPIIER